ncbi:MAG: hypothetical protein IT383_03060 [Deltaproteobacteria bacterium]|nr:hypothetical protein [Deltaproteobacteria bacterium]
MCRLVVAITALAILCSCAAAQKTATLPPLALAAEAVADAPAARPTLLTENHFARDALGGLSEAQLKDILQAPVFLEEKARVGVVPVREGYGADEELPLAGVPGVLASTLDETGLFEVVSEVSTDFPATGSLAGLRELAARYRADYLLLYRHRFVDSVYPSGWAWTWATLVGPLFAPANVLETEGVIEATLFDVKTGTILFTTFERMREKQEDTVLDTERKQKHLKERVLEEVAERISEDVVAQVRRLAAARPIEGAVAAVEGAR